MLSLHLSWPTFSNKNVPRRGGLGALPPDHFVIQISPSWAHSLSRGNRDYSRYLLTTNQSFFFLQIHLPSFLLSLGLSVSRFDRRFFFSSEVTKLPLQILCISLTGSPPAGSSSCLLRNLANQLPAPLFDCLSVVVVAV